MGGGQMKKAMWLVVAGLAGAAIALALGAWMVRGFAGR